MDRFDTARRGNLDRQFQSEALRFLERIAIALENNGLVSHEAPQPQPLIPEDKDPSYNADAQICTCGNNPKKACSQCTSARMAWVYNMNPGWQP